MKIQGSCYCKKVMFEFISHTPYPYMRCYCSICRKTAGGGGYAVNIMGEAKSLQVTGEQNIRYHRALIPNPENPQQLIQSEGKRYFCESCGSALWIFDSRWPEAIYPFASAMDTPLPIPPEIVHIMLEFAAPWANIPQGPGHVHFNAYPKESIADWHKRHGLYAID